jgi:flagellar basal-body rod modification protein FlgD
VDVEILDTAGQLVRRLTAASLEPGTQAVEWNGRDDSGRPVAAGTYFYRVSAPGAGGDPGELPLVASGTLTAIERRGSQLLFRVGDALVRQEDIVDLG